MVVGIYSVPEMMSPKRRCSDGSASLLPCGRPNKRCREETAATPEAQELQEHVPTVVLLEENGGIWHVDCLLELLAGALCATLGADPASLDMTCAAEGASTCSVAVAEHSAKEYNYKHIQQPQQQQRSALTVLTEMNLQAHTASAQVLASPHHSNPDEEDRSSVASLSMWAVGTQPPRQRGSEAGAMPISSSSSSSHHGPLITAPGFSFAVSCLASRCGSDGGCAVAEGPESRWPRRRVSASGRR